MQRTANTGAFEVFSESKKINLHIIFSLFSFAACEFKHGLVAVFSAFNLK